MENTNTVDELKKEIKQLNLLLNELMLLSVSIEKKQKKATDPQIKQRLQLSLDRILARIVDLNAEIHNITLSAVTEITDVKESEEIRRMFEGASSSYEDDTPSKSI